MIPVMTPEKEDPSLAEAEPYDLQMECMIIREMQ